MKTQFLTDEKGNIISIVIPLDEYKRIMEDLEELEDIRLFDEVKGRNEKSIPFEEYLKKRQKKSNYA
jgi:PHD/YefM family antitoxin component YafN of YafNO toxin-antitoxin module